MNIHHEAAAGKTHNSSMTTHTNSHVHQVPVAHRVSSAGSLRARASAKRNQKGKSPPPDAQGAFKMEMTANGSVLGQRLAAAVKTKRLDLSLPRQGQVPTELSVKNKTLHIPPFQLFPSVIIEHVNIGHHLTELWLTNHHVACLPAEITVFTNLRVLGLAGNALTALPVEISQLTSLETLCLEKNRLQTLPAKVAFPPLLRELRLDYNELSVFPTQITKLRLLNRLGLSYNRLKVLPEQIQRLRNLVELDLDYNCLESELPEGFAALQRLERLGLEGNFLAEKPPILDRLLVLSSIRLSGNRAKKYLPTTNGSVGSTRQLLAIPKRPDGYFQYVKSSSATNDIKKEDSSETDHMRMKKEHRCLEGVVPCHDQNLLNAMAFQSFVLRP